MPAPDADAAANALVAPPEDDKVRMLVVVEPRGFEYTCSEQKTALANIREQRVVGRIADKNDGVLTHPQSFGDTSGALWSGLATAHRCSSRRCACQRPVFSQTQPNGGRWGSVDASCSRSRKWLRNQSTTTCHIVFWRNGQLNKPALVRCSKERKWPKWQHCSRWIDSSHGIWYFQLQLGADSTIQSVLSAKCRARNRRDMRA